MKKKKIIRISNERLEGRPLELTKLFKGHSLIFNPLYSLKNVENHFIKPLYSFANFYK